MKSKLGVCIVIPMMISTIAHAEMSNRFKTILLMIGTTSVGATIGALTTPPTDNVAPHAALWGGVGAAVGGVSGLFIFDSEAEKERLTLQTQKLSAELERYQRETEPVPLGSLPEGADMPSEVKSIIRPGRWTLYQIGEKGQWIKQNDKKWIHQDQLLLYRPGGISPGVEPSLPRLDSSVMHSQPQTEQVGAGRLSQTMNDVKGGSE